MTDTAVKINEQWVAIDDAAWLYFAPCGCLKGVALAVFIGPEEDDALKEFADPHTKRQAARDRRAGYTARLVTRDECNAAWLDRLTEKCPHAEATS